MLRIHPFCTIFQMAHDIGRKFRQQKGPNISKKDNFLSNMRLVKLLDGFLINTNSTSPLCDVTDCPWPLRHLNRKMLFRR